MHGQTVGTSIIKQSLCNLRVCGLQSLRMRLCNVVYAFANTNISAKTINKSNEKSVLGGSGELRDSLKTMKYSIYTLRSFKCETKRIFGVYYTRYNVR